MPSTILMMVVPVNSIVLPDPAGRDSDGEIVERGAGEGPPPFDWPTT